MVIRVYGEHNDLVIEVEDNGGGMTQEQMDGMLKPEDGEASSRFSGMGVRNVHERIVRLYGEPYGIRLFSEPGKYTKARIRFPKLYAEEVETIGKEAM